MGNRSPTTHHGIFKPICVCTVMKYAKTPVVSADAAIMIISQRFSCASGQWYFRRRSTWMTSVVIAAARQPLGLGPAAGLGPSVCTRRALSAFTDSS